MGGGSNTTRQRSNTTSNADTTAQSTGVSAYSPNPPAPDILNSLWSGAQAVGSIPYHPVMQGTAAMTPVQNAAIRQGFNLMGQSNNAVTALSTYFTQIPAMAQQAANSANAMYQQSARPLTAADINQYLNPYINNVTANLNEVFGQQNRDVTGGLTQAAGGVGASRIAVGQAELARQQGLAAGQTYAGIYQNALNAAEQQRQMQQSAASGMAQTGLAAANAIQNAGTGYGSLINTNIGNQASLLGQEFGYGSAQQATNQNALNALYTQQQQQVAFPYQVAQFVAGLGLPTAQAFGGSNTYTQGSAGHQTGSQQGLVTTTQPAPSPFSQIAGIGTALLGAFGNRGGRIQRNRGGYVPMGGVAGMGSNVHMGEPYHLLTHFARGGGTVNKGLGGWLSELFSPFSALSREVDPLFHRSLDPALSAVAKDTSRLTPAPTVPKTAPLLPLDSVDNTTNVAKTNLNYPLPAYAGQSMKNQSRLMPEIDTSDTPTITGMTVDPILDLSRNNFISEPLRGDKPIPGAEALTASPFGRAPGFQPSLDPNWSAADGYTPSFGTPMTGTPMTDNTGGLLKPVSNPMPGEVPVTPVTTVPVGPASPADAASPFAGTGTSPASPQDAKFDANPVNPTTEDTGNDTGPEYGRGAGSGGIADQIKALYGNNGQSDLPFGWKPWNLALMAAGLGMLGGKSPNALQNIGEGGAQGLNFLKDWYQMDTNNKAKMISDMLEAQRNSILENNSESQATHRQVMDQARLGAIDFQTGSHMLDQYYENHKEARPADYKSGSAESVPVLPPPSEDEQSVPVPKTPYKVNYPKDLGAEDIPNAVPNWRSNVPDNVDSFWNPQGVTPNKFQLQALADETKTDNKNLQADYEAAQKLKGALDQQAEYLHKQDVHGILAPGPGQSERGALYSLVKTVESIAGKKMDPKFMSELEKAGNIEAIRKMQTQLGFAMARTLGTREAMQVIQQAMSTNPGLGMTLYGQMNVLYGLRALNDRAIDRYNFVKKWQSKSHYYQTAGAEDYFDNAVGPVDHYLNRSNAMRDLDIKRMLRPGDDKWSAGVKDYITDLGGDPAEAGFI